MEPVKPIRRALISVADKRGIVALGRVLAARGVQIISTGGTAGQLRENGIEVTEIGDYTGFAEIMAGRVKTLHPKIHAGILARRGEDDAVLAQLEIQTIDLVVVNLYPFGQVIRTPGCRLSEALENIDIGGPAMLRAAAKNHRHVTVVTDRRDYDRVIEQIERDQAVDAQTRFDLAVTCFAHTAQYDAAIADYLGALRQPEQADGEGGLLPPTLTLRLEKKQPLRYGENPHQLAAFYLESDGADTADFEQLQGKALSYNNIADTDAALACVQQFQSAHACVIVKHANPCGVARKDTQLAAYVRAFDTDPESAFGGIIAFNRGLQAATADAIVQRQFVEVIIAPGVDEDARRLLTGKPNIRLLITPSRSQRPQLDYKRVAGGLLVQQADSALYQSLDAVTKRCADEAEMRDLKFAWKVSKYVKSNAIVYARDEATVGVGAGQMSRINSARIAALKAQQAGFDLPAAVMASDAFFPFRDGVDNAAKDGITAVIQPGGGLRDAEVIAAANEHNIAMVLTSMRHFRH